MDRQERRDAVLLILLLFTLAACVWSLVELSARGEGYRKRLRALEVQGEQTSVRLSELEVWKSLQERGEGR